MSKFLDLNYPVKIFVTAAVKAFFRMVSVKHEKPNCKYKKIWLNFPEIIFYYVSRYGIPVSWNMIKTI
jgi:hypothetical protein